MCVDRYVLHQEVIFCLYFNMTCQHKLKNSFYKFPLKFQIEITNAMISSYSLQEAELDFMNYISVKKKNQDLFASPRFHL